MVCNDAGFGVAGQCLRGDWGGANASMLSVSTHMVQAWEAGRGLLSWLTCAPPGCPRSGKSLRSFMPRQQTSCRLPGFDHVRTESMLEFAPSPSLPLRFICHRIAVLLNGS